MGYLRYAHTLLAISAASLCPGLGFAQAGPAAAAVAQASGGEPPPQHSPEQTTAAPRDDSRDDNDSKNIQEVVVTGTHIRGVSAVGSATINLGEEDFKRAGAADLNTLLQKVPAVTNIGMNESTNFGGARPQSAGGNTALQSSVNLRGVGTDATLVLFNGQRIAGGGSGALVDPNNFAPDMISRVDVQADGGSAIYGSDAIAGTVNFILREPTDMARVYSQALFKRGDTGWDSGTVLGKKWLVDGLGDGGIVFNYQHTYTAPTAARDVPYAFNDNLTPYIGAAGAFPTNSSPGNLMGFGATAAQQATLYATPAAGIAPGGQLTLDQLGAAGMPNRTSAYTRVTMVTPEMNRDTASFNFKQDVTDWLHFFSFGTYNRRTGVASYGSTPQPVATLNIPNTNPYSPCATAAAAALAGLPPPNQLNSQGLACPANGALKMAYDLVNEYGSSEIRRFNEETHLETAGFDFDLPAQWHGRVTQSLSRVTTTTSVNNQINTTALAQVISGVGKPSNVPYFNPFCSDQDAPCNNPLTINYFRGQINNGAVNGLKDYNFGLDGPLFTLPAGPVRLALGAEYTDESSLVTTSSEITSAIGLTIPGNNALGKRFDRAAYSEAYVPLVNPGMGIPLIARMELTAAVRYTDYSLPRMHTVNPKFGFNYSPIEDVKLHGSWGTSFRAPTISQSLPTSTASILGGNNLQTCSQYAGIVCPSPTTQVTGIFFNGGNEDLEPQKGKTWSLGLDWQPSFISGLSLSATYYRLSYTNLISEPGAPTSPAAEANAGYLDSLIIFNPTYFPSRAVVNDGVLAVLPGLTRGTALTQAQFDSVLPTLIAKPQYAITAPPIGPVAFISNGLQQNSGFIHTDGIDFSGQYVFNTPVGVAHVGGLATVVLNYLYQPVSGGPVKDEKNRFGYVTTFHGRLEGGLTRGAFDGSLYMNYNNAYAADPNFVPIAALSSNYDFLHISSYLTFDLSLGWNVGESFDKPALHNLGVQLTAINLLDRKPPFFLNAGTSPPILFDSNQASALGRTITVRLQKDF